MSVNAIVAAAAGLSSLLQVDLFEISGSTFRVVIVEYESRAMVGLVQLVERFPAAGTLPNRRHEGGLQFLKNKIYFYPNARWNSTEFQREIKKKFLLIYLGPAI